jgi:polyphosphate glucokinase
MKKVLVVDIGGTSVKLLANGQKTARRFLSGPTLTPRQMVAEVKQHAADWNYDVVSLGYPGVVRRGRVALEPQNLGAGWVGFDFRSAFRHPVRVINDAAMQALGSYRGGLMLFVGLGTGVGSALVADGVVIPMELGHLAYKRGTYEDYIGLRGLKWLGKKRWRQHVINVVTRLVAAIHPDDVVLGGGHGKELGKLPKGWRIGDNAHAFLGGVGLWEDQKRKERRRR